MRGTTVPIQGNIICDFLPVAQAYYSLPLVEVSPIWRDTFSKHNHDLAALVPDFQRGGP